MSLSANVNEKAGLIWAIADKLTGVYKPHEYGEAGHKEPKKDSLTIIISKINEKFGTNFTEMDKVLLHMENDYATQEKWQSYAKHNDRKTFKLLFNKDFPEIAAKRYEENDSFFLKLFSDSEMMNMVMDTMGNALYERLKSGAYVMPPQELPMVAEDMFEYK